MLKDGIGGACSSTVKFLLAGGAQPVILLPVRVNNEGPFQFIFDTGAVASVTAGSGQMQLSGGSVSSLQLGAARIEALPVLIGPFLAVLSEAAGSHLHGIVCYNFLRNYKVTIDYPNQLLSLFSPC